MSGRGGEWSLAAMALGLAIAGCAAVAPVPVDHFYRLPEPAPPAPSALARGWGRAVLVEPFSADGLHTERALVFSEDAQGVSLMRYHYHHWVDGPPNLVQEYVAARIRAAAPNTVVLTDADGPVDTVVSGRVKRFDHHVHGKHTFGQAVVRLELRLDREGRSLPLLVKDYSARVPVRADNMVATVDAFGEGMATIVDAFIADAEAVLAKEDPRPRGRRSPAPASR